MDFKRILITGGAGFVGANLAVAFRRAFPGVAVIAFDNLKRRGSELNLSRLRDHGVTFLHGDIRCREDVAAWPRFDLLIDCAAEPSVQAGLDGSPLPVIQSNLTGTIYCLEEARRHQAAVLFLSTSRVYPIGPLNGLAFREDATRFAWIGDDAIRGYSPEGVAEDFPLEGVRSLYGATKLSVELLLQEYAFSFGMPVMINRCGILAGPWQMGKVDQGVVTLWVARHAFGTPLRYTGFGGQGKQVRDMLHVDDLFALLLAQLDRVSLWDGRVYNVGGGLTGSASLAELTDHCRRVTGNAVPMSGDPTTSPVDVRIYLTDRRKVAHDFGWKPQRSVAQIVDDVHTWIRQNETQLRTFLA